MQEQISHFEVNNITYPLALTLNVLEEIQKKYGSYEEWGKLTDGKGKEVNADGEEVNKEVNIEALKFGIREMINEGIDIENENEALKRDFVTSKQVGRIITNLGLEKMVEKVHTVVIDSTKTEENSKNA